MSDIFHEVDEELRRERLGKLWDRYGIFVIGAAVAIVLATAGHRGWQYWQTTRAAASGDKFVAAVDLADTGQVSDAELAEMEQYLGPSTLAKLQTAEDDEEDLDADVDIDIDIDEDDDQDEDDEE